MMVKISIVIPIYNVADYLEKCIESVCSQTHSNLEIILVNDGSTDESLCIARKYEKRDNRILVIDQENQGANVARNKGLLHATGEWVCFVDGDDWLDVTMCAELAQYLNTDLDILFYTYRKVYPTKTIQPTYRNTKFEIKKNDFRELQVATLNRLGPYRFGEKVMETVRITNKLYRRKFLLDNNILFDESLPKLQDLLFNLKVYDYANNGYVVNDIFYNYRIHGASVTQRYQSDICKKFEIIHKSLNEFMIKHSDDNEMQQAFYERIATHLRTCVVLNFCHFQNPKDYKRRKAEFKKACQDEIFCEAMKNVNLTHFPFKERFLSKCIKGRWFAMCELLYKLNTFMQSFR